MAEDVEAFPTLGDADVTVFDALGTRRSTAVGELLYREGDATYDFYVVVSGAVEILVAADREERVIARHGAGRFLGELSLLTGMRVFVSARVVEPGEVIVVPRTALQRVIATSPHLSDTILAAFLARRSGLMTDAASAVRVVGSRFSPESLRIREFLARSGIPHEWLDPDRDPADDEPCDRAAPDVVADLDHRGRGPDARWHATLCADAEAVSRVADNRHHLFHHRKDPEPHRRPHRGAAARERPTEFHPPALDQIRLPPEQPSQ